ncbi:GATA transcription factor 1 [Sesamum angolense]|uniref:GATA transcription factor 1 n=1 Tax=Sesamum angolense TaxID=2727404 RepID=A0AAE2BJU6_9LAMI|nr:GATA transcription factor 1 [Sesamum angolense]
MEILDTAAEACFMVDDDLLNFTLEEGEGEEEEEPTISKGASASSSSLECSNPAATAFRVEARSGSFSEFVEEELEWLSNKDAFPAVETCFGILSDNPELILNQHSPVSVLEKSSSSSNSNTNSNGSAVASCCDSFKVPMNYPVRARSKRRRRRRAGFGDLPSQQCLWLNKVSVKNKQEPSFALPPLPMLANGGAGLGRRCLHCHADKTPQWRAGPMGPKTLCNACGVRYKSGRLLPEYRPASSPTFSSTLHSNSHRKVIEMRKQKQLPMGDAITVNVACGYRVG